MATIADAALSRGWVHRAKQAGDEAVQRLEDDAGECLMDCCAKDLRNQAFEADLTAQLASLDPIQAATRARQIAALPSPAAAQPQCSARDADDADGELQALRARKLAALQRRQRGAAAAAADGYGRLVDVKAEDAEALIFDTSVPAAVCHLWLPGLAAELDEALQLLALDRRGTRVVRAPAARAAALLRRLRRPEGAWLVAARRGHVVGIAAADGEAGPAAGRGGAAAARARRGGSGDESSDFEGSDDEHVDWVESTKAWLQRLGVLIREPPSSGGVAQADGGDSSDVDGGQSEEANDLGDPCPICGRTYYHVHKGAVRQGRQGGYSSDD